MKAFFQILSSLLLASLVLGCQKLKEEPGTGITPSAGLVKVVCHTVASKQTFVSRSVNETDIRDLNVYLYGISNNKTYQFYFDSGTIEMHIEPGTYNMYVIANKHEKLPAIGEPELLFASSQNQDELIGADYVVMFANKEIVVAKQKNDSTVTLPNITLTRNIAKIEYNIKVDRNLTSVELLSVQFCNVPWEFPWFEPENFTQTNFIDDNPVIVQPGTYEVSGTYYMFSNMQGENPSIKDQREKNFATAPDDATYIHIRGKENERIFDYFVWLGENNTTSFNIARNTAHTIDITISGFDELDTRFYGYSIGLIEDGHRFNHLNYLLLDNRCDGYLYIEGAGKDHYNFKGTIQFLQYPEDCLVQFNYNWLHTRPIEFNFDENGEYRYYISLDEHDKIKGDGLIKYRITVTDNYGYSKVIDRHLTARNLLTVYSHRFNNNEKGSGTVSVSGEDIYISEQFENADSSGVEVLYTEKGVQIQAIPSKGYKFTGWHHNYHFNNNVYSHHQILNFIPTNNESIIFARFERETVKVFTSEQHIEFSCDQPFEYDAESGAYLLPYGAKCTLKPKRPGFKFKGWYERADGGKIVSADDIIDFTASEDMVCYPVFWSPERLDVAGTANSYIPRDKNTSYAFDYTKKGNGKSTLNIVHYQNKASTVGIIWESGNLHNEVIKDVGMESNDVIFLTGHNYGNAVIGVFDDIKRVVWSWHIWFCDYNPLDLAQIYPNGQQYMDRNMGSFIEDQNIYSYRYGLYYQWGRKDPFTPPNQINVVYHNGFKFVNTADFTPEVINSTIDYAVRNPTTFIASIHRGASSLGPEQQYDWLITPHNNLWGNQSIKTPDFNKVGDKTIYDPCPAGWRVPYWDAWFAAGFSPSTLMDHNNNTFTYGLSNSVIAKYHLGGYIEGMTGNYISPGSTGFYWSRDPDRIEYADFYKRSTGFYIGRENKLNMTIVNFPLDRATAAMIRCMKE